MSSGYASPFGTLIRLRCTEITMSYIHPQKTNQHPLNDHWAFKTGTYGWNKRVRPHCCKTPQDVTLSALINSNL